MTRIIGAPTLESPADSEPLSVAQIRSDALLEDFTSQSTNFSAISSFAAAGLVGHLFRNAFLASKIFNANSMNVFGGHLAGLVAESGFLTYSQHPAQATSQDYLKEFRTHFMNLACLRITGAVLHMSPAILRHSSSSMAQVSAHHLAIHLGWEQDSHKSLTEEFFEAEIMNWQFEIGNKLGNFFSGHRLHQLQRNFDQSSQTLSPLSQNRETFSRLYSDNTAQTNRNSLQNIKYHPNFERGFTSTTADIQFRTLSVLERLALGEKSRGMNKKKFKGTQTTLMQVRINGQYRLLFVRRDRKIEIIHLGSHNETDRFIRQYIQNPIPESHSNPFDPFATRVSPSLSETSHSSEETGNSPQRTPENWAAHWERLNEEKRARSTPVPEEPFEIEEAITVLADPNRVLNGRIEATFLTEFPELATILDERIVELSEESLWRGDPDARTLLHFIGLRQRLNQPHLLHPNTVDALKNMDEILEAATASDDPQEISGLVADYYRALHPYDRLRLQAERPEWADLTQTEMAQTFLDFIITRRWNGEHQDRLIAASVQNPEASLVTLAQWAIQIPSRPLRNSSPPSSSLTILERAQAIFPEFDFFAHESSASFTPEESKRWKIGSNASLKFWNQAPVELRRLLRGYSQALENSFATSHFMGAIQHISDCASQGANPTRLLDYSLEVLGRARALEEKSIRSALQKDPARWAAACDEIHNDPLRSTGVTLNNRDFRIFFGERNHDFTSMLLRMARHSVLGKTLSDKIWEITSDQELDDASAHRFLAHLHQKSAALYLKHREELRGELPSVFGNPLLDPNENVLLALSIPDDCPEIHAFSLRELTLKKENIRIALTLHDSDSTPILLDHARPNGIIRETLLTHDAHEEMKAQPAHTPFTINGKTEERGDIVSARPYTVTYRLTLLLQSMLGPDTHRLMMMGLNFDHFFRAQARSLASRAGNLLLAGAPSSWVVTQFATRYIEAYRAQRIRILEEISIKCPGIYRDAYFKIPEHDLLRNELAIQILLENGIDRENVAHRHIINELGEIFKLYAKFTANRNTNPIDPTAVEITDRITRVFILHHPLFNKMLGLPKDLSLFMNTFSLVVNAEQMPELFNPNDNYDKLKTRVTPPAPVNSQSEIADVYIRAVLFLKSLANRGVNADITTFMDETLPRIASEQDGVHTVLATLQFYFIHREIILAELSHLLR